MILSRTLKTFIVVAAISFFCVADGFAACPGSCSSTRTRSHPPTPGRTRRPPSMPVVPRTRIIAPRHNITHKRAGTIRKKSTTVKNAGSAKDNWEDAYRKQIKELEDLGVDKETIRQILHNKINNDDSMSDSDKAKFKNFVDKYWGGGGGNSGSSRKPVTGNSNPGGNNASSGGSRNPGGSKGSVGGSTNPGGGGISSIITGTTPGGGGNPGSGSIPAGSGKQVIIVNHNPGGGGGSILPGRNSAPPTPASNNNPPAGNSIANSNVPDNSNPGGGKDRSSIAGRDSEAGNSGNSENQDTSRSTRDDDLEDLRLLINPDGKIYDPSVVELLDHTEKMRLKELIKETQKYTMQENKYHENRAQSWNNCEKAAGFITKTSAKAVTTIAITIATGGATLPVAVSKACNLIDTAVSGTKALFSMFFG